MKKSLLPLLLCAGILTGCGNQALPAEPTETSTVSQITTAVQTADNEITTTTTAGISEVTESCSDEISSVTTEMETTTTTGAIPNDTESTTTIAFVQEKETSAVQSITTKVDTTEPVVTSKGTTTTNKPVTTTTKATTTTATTTTVVATTTNPDDRYIEVGRNLSHDGTDYGKAKAVYDWMTANGFGTCVNYSYQTYLVCQGIGLDCYICWTDAGIYGHVANVVKVNGIWFVLDTQGGYFLHYNYGFTEVIDINENHVADGSMLSDYSYEELYG